MDDGQRSGSSTSGGSAAYTAARELLDGAERDAARIVAEAERRARAREQEADLLVAKARRLLAAAEEKASVILATARAEAGTVIDLTEGAVADQGPSVVSPAPPVHAEALPSSLDRLVASAVAHAVHRALPADATP